MTHIAEWKKRTVEELEKLMEEYPIIGIVRIDNLPALQMNRLREILRGKVIIKVAKKRLIKRALENIKDKKKNIEGLLNYLDGMVGLIFTKENPFKLAKIIEKNKSNAPARPGQIAPKDIVIKAGKTSFAPGPIISELSSIGLKVGVEGGKVAIKEDKVVVKEGEVINEKVASVLSRLGIEPMEIGLDLRAVYENGNVFDAKVLFINEEEYINNIKEAYSNAFFLSVGICYPTSENIKLLLSKAYNDARNIVIYQEIFVPDLIKELILKAYNSAYALNNKISC